MLGRPCPLGLPGRRHRLWGPPFLTTPSFSQDLSSPAHQIRLWGILSLTAPRAPPPSAFSGIRAEKGGWRWLELSLPLPPTLRQNPLLF